MEYDTYVAAPGKIMWIGGYSVLEQPNVSFVTSASSHVHVYANSLPGNEVLINVPMFNLSIKGTVNSTDGKIDIQVPAQLKLVKTSAEIATRYAAAIGYRPQGFSLRSENDNQFAYRISQGADSKVTKSGLGSSAAITVGTVAAVLTNQGIEVNQRSVIHNLAQIAHAIATEKVGSGFDIAASTYGGITYTRYNPSLVKDFPVDYTNPQLADVVTKKWDYSIEPMKMPALFQSIFANFVGNGALTVSLVKEVYKFKEREPEAYFELMTQINDRNMAAINALRKINEHIDIQGNLMVFKEAMHKGRALTKELGGRSKIDIESDRNTKLIDRSERTGAFVAKLPGAGGEDAIVALTLGAARRDRVKKLWSSNPKLDVLNLSLNNEGFSIKQAAKIKTK